MKSKYLIGLLILLLIAITAPVNGQGCGDVNQDGAIDIADLVYLLDYVIVVNGPPPINMADANMDLCNDVDIADIAYFINYFFNSGPAPCAGIANCTVINAGMISLDHVDGLLEPGVLSTGVPITFYLRLTNNTGSDIYAFTNGFTIYSPDGAIWGTVNVDSTGTLGMSTFNLGIFNNNYNSNGTGADTVSIGGVTLGSGTGFPGMVDGFDDVAFTITIGPLDTSDIGKTICLDSTFYTPAGYWKWSKDGLSSYSPSWDGTHCFTISNPPEPSGASISLDHVDGLVGGDTIATGIPITFNLRVSNITGNTINGLTNGFRVYSPDGAEWNTLIGDTIGTIGMGMFDLVFIIEYSGVTGSGADSVLFGGVKMFGSGLPSPFDEVSYAITIGPIDSIYSNNTICLDSSFIPPSGLWLWSGDIIGPIVPDWDGPHCFTVVYSEPPPPGDDSLIIPSMVIESGNGIQPVMSQLSQPIKGATVPIKIPENVEIISVSTEGLITENWDYTFIQIKQDSGFLFVALANSFGAIIPPDTTTLFNIHYSVYNSSCETSTSFHWDTTLMNDVSRRLTYADTSLFPVYPGFDMFRDVVEVAPFLPGDCNNDGLLDIADLICIVDYMFFGSPPPTNINSIDVNGDCIGPDIADLVYLVEYMFGDGLEPQCGCINGGPKAVVKTNDDISINTIFENGITTVLLNSQVDLKGIQFKLQGQNNAEPVKLFDDNLDLIFGETDEAYSVGILDLDGGEYLPAGRRELIKLEGEYRLVSAVVADMNTQSIVPVINSKLSSIPEKFKLFQNYPNPFNPNTEIGFSLPEAADVKLEIYNIMGQKVATLVDRKLEAGEYTYVWDGSKAASGVYLYRLDTKTFTDTKKMMLLK